MPIATPTTNTGKIPKQTSLYQPIELSFTSAKKYTVSQTPWLSVSFDAVFLHSSGIKMTVPGYWDGGNSFIIRFAPTVIGNWSYTTVSDTDTALNGQTGLLYVTPHLGGNLLYQNGGFLKVSENGRFLTYTNGEPFFYLSDTWWYALSDSNMPVQKVLKPCLDKRKEQGFTVIISGMIGQTNGVEIQTAYHASKDIQLAYWQQLDAAVKEITSAGMVLMLAPLWSDAAAWCTEDEWIELIDYMNARYSAYPVFFGMAPEYNSPGKAQTGLDDMALHLLEHYSDIDPYSRALSIQPFPWNLIANKKDWDEGYIDFLMLEGGHEDPFGIPTSFYQDAWDKTIGGRHRPLVLAETTWEGITRHGYLHDDYTMRFNQYRAFLSGCVGMQYGANGLWYPTQNEQDTAFTSDWGQAQPWYDALALPGAQTGKYLKDFFNALDWWTIEPLFGAGQPNSTILPPCVKETADADYVAPVAAKFENGQKVIVYIPATSDRTIFIKMKSDQLRTGSYLYSWLNPRTGESRKGGTVDILPGSFTLPNKPDDRDWVLMIKN